MWRWDCYRVKTRYFIRFYCLAVNSGFYSDMEECSSSSIQETWVRVRAGDTLFGVTSLRTGQQDGTWLNSYHSGIPTDLNAILLGAYVLGHFFSFSENII